MSFFFLLIMQPVSFGRAFHLVYSNEICVKCNSSAITKTNKRGIPALYPISSIIVTSWTTLPKASTGRQVLIAHLAFNMLAFTRPNLWVFPLGFFGGGVEKSRENAFQSSLPLVFAALLSLFKLRRRLKPQGVWWGVVFGIEDGAA